jgi:hypothetical protein
VTFFTATWNGAYEGIPADSENINQGASRIRDLKVEVRERFAVDHSFAGDANDGLHLHVELIPQSAAPTLVNATDGALYTQVITGNTELVWLDSSGHVLQITSNGIFAPMVAQSFTASGGDGQLYLAYSGVSPILNFETNTYILFDASVSKFKFVVGGVVVGQFPP